MSEKTIAEAFTAAQSEFPAVEPDAVNPHFKSKFVSLGHLLAKVRPILNRHGLSVIQLPTRDEDGTPTLKTVILHESGERIEADAPLLLSKQDPQGQGSAITYMRRYALAAALGISDQEDDDGNAGVRSVEADRASSGLSGDSVATLLDAIKDSGIGFSELCDTFGTLDATPPATKNKEAIRNALAKLEPQQADRMLGWLNG